MRASPAFHITLERFGVWRWGVSVVAGCGVVCLATWAVNWAERPSTVRLAMLLVTGLLIGWAALSLCRMPAMELRWDGQIWHAGEPGEVQSGELAVALDLGSWMLLRFRPAASGRKLAQRWLPVQRSGIESQWHGLRCAVYSPRPAPQQAVQELPSGAAGDF